MVTVNTAAADCGKALTAPAGFRYGVEMTSDELVDRIRTARDKGADKFVHAIRADTQIRIAKALNDILDDQAWESPV